MAGSKRLKISETKSNWPEMPIHFSEEVKEVYQKRREDLDRIMSKLETLEKGTVEYSRTYRRLKARISTDPLMWQSHEKWAKDQRGKDSKGDSLMNHAHHRLGLDDYLNFIKNLDDAELYEFHKEMGERGFYFGNHPKNLKFLYPDEHKGDTESFSPYSDSAHGQYEFTRLKDSGELRKFVEEFVNTGSTTTFGNPTSDQLQRRRYQLPTSEELDDMSLEDIIDRASYFANEDNISLEYLARRGIDQGPGSANTNRDALGPDATALELKNANRQIEGAPPRVKTLIKSVGFGRLSPEILDALSRGSWVEAAAMLNPAARALKIGAETASLTTTGKTLEQASEESKNIKAAGGYDTLPEGFQQATASMNRLNPQAAYNIPFEEQFRPSDKEFLRRRRLRIFEARQKEAQERNSGLSEEDRNIYEAGGGNAAMTKYGWDIKQTMAQGYKNLLLQTPDYE